MSSYFFLLLYFSISVQISMIMLNSLKQQLSDNCPMITGGSFDTNRRCFINIKNIHVTNGVALSLFKLEYMPTKEIIHLMNPFLLLVIKNVPKTSPFVLI